MFLYFLSEQVEQLDLLPQYVDEKNHARTCMYLVSCCNYLPEPDDQKVGMWAV